MKYTIEFIPVSESVPGYDADVFIRFSNGNVSIGKLSYTDQYGHHWELTGYNGLSKHCNAFKLKNEYRITHWAPYNLCN